MSSTATMTSTEDRNSFEIACVQCVKAEVGKFSYLEEDDYTTIRIRLGFKDVTTASEACELVTAPSFPVDLTMKTGVSINNVVVQDFGWWGSCKQHLHNGVVGRMHFIYIHPPSDTASKEEISQWLPGGEASVHLTTVKVHGHDVLPPVDRSRKDNNDTRAISGMKTTYFSFVAYDDDIIFARQFTCNCEVCQGNGVERVHLGSRCKNYNHCGPWVLFRMTENGVIVQRINEWLSTECDETNSWPRQHHDECGLSDAPCSRGGTNPGDTLLKCSYCPGAFHLECVGLSHRKRHKGVWACPSCVKAAKTGLETGTTVDPSLLSIEETTTPEPIETSTVSLKGHVVAIVNDDFPIKSDHAFELGWIRTGEKISTQEDVDSGRTDVVGDIIVEIVLYTQSTDLCFELVSSHTFVWMKSHRIFNTNVKHKLNMRRTRQKNSTRTHRTAPKRMYILENIYNELSVDADHHSN